LKNFIELGLELPGELRIIDYQQVLVIPLLSVGADIIRSTDDDLLIDDHHLVMHIAWIPVYTNIQTGIKQIKIFAAYIGVYLAAFDRNITPAWARLRIASAMSSDVKNTPGSGYCCAPGCVDQLRRNAVIRRKYTFKCVSIVRLG
jgi:hypothetical protein